MAEYWLVHAVDRMVTIYRLAGDEYGKPDVFALTGETPVAILPGVAVTWEPLLGGLPDPEA